MNFPDKFPDFFLENQYQRCLNPNRYHNSKSSMCIHHSISQNVLQNHHTHSPEIPTVSTDGRREVKEAQYLDNLANFPRTIYNLTRDGKEFNVVSRHIGYMSVKSQTTDAILNTRFSQIITKFDIDTQSSKQQPKIQPITRTKTKIMETRTPS